LAKPFASPFEKLSGDNQKVIVEQLSPGGELFSIFEEILKQLQGTEQRQVKDEAETKVSLFAGLTIKEAIAWKILGEKGLQAVGKGLGGIAEVIDKMTTSGKEVKERMEGISMGIEAVMGIAPKILKFAILLTLALPFLITGMIAVPLVGLMLVGMMVIMSMLAPFAATAKITMEALTLLGKVGTSILLFGVTLALAGLVYPFALLALVVIIPTLLITMVALTIIGGLTSKKSLEKFTGLRDVGIGILLFGGLLLLSGYVYPMAFNSLKSIIGTLAIMLIALTLIGFLVNKKSLEKFKDLRDVGIGILLFGVAIVLSGFVYQYALKSIPIIMGVILGFALLFFVLDKLKFTKSVNKGAKALKKLGIAILILGAALFIFGLLFPPTKETFKTLGFTMLVLVGLAFAMWIVGKFSKGIKKGAIGLALTGIAIIILAYALKKFEAALPANPWEFMAQLGVALVGLGVIMWGYGKQWKTIGKGALVLAGTGLALAVMGWGVGSMAEALNSTGDPWMFMAELGVFLVGMGVMAAGWGFASALILLGAAAMGATGLALKSVSFGLEGFIPIFKGSEWKSMIGTHHQSKGFLGMGAGPVSNFQTLMESVGYSFRWNPLNSGMILAGSVALGAAGLALWPIAKGIKAMMPIFKGNGWREMISTKGNPKSGGFMGIGATAQTNIQLLINSLGEAFKFGFGSINIGAGAAAMVVVGHSLIKIGKGIADFMKHKIDKKVAKNISVMVESIAGAFGRIGRKYGGAGFFGLGAGALYDGIQSTMGMGDALTSIAKGMKAVSVLRFPTYGDPNDPGKITEYITVDKGAMNKISANVAMMVESLAGAFGRVGRMFPNKPKSGLWGFLGGTDNPVKTGIQSVSGMGSALGGIAEGMKSFSTLKFHKYDDPSKPEKITETIDLTKGDVLKKVTDNIVMMVVALAGGFATIGRRYPKKKHKGFFGTTYTTTGPVGVGIEQSSGMGGVVAGIGAGLKDFSTLKFPVYKGTKIVDYIDLTKGNVLKKVTANIVDMILSLATGFGNVARRFPRRKYKTWWGATRYAPDGKVGEGVKQASGMGGVISELGKGLKDFSTLKFPEYKGKKLVGYTSLTSGGMKKVTDNIVNMIVSLMDGFGRIGKKYPFKRASGLLGELGINNTGDVGAGIAQGKYLGRVLGNLARGISWFAILKFPRYKGTRIVGYDTMTGDAPKKVAKNIFQMIYYPMDAFGRIGKKYPMGPPKGLFGSRLSGAAGQGISSAKYLGRRLASIAIGYMYMAKLKFPEYDDPSNPEKVTGYKTLAGDNLKKLAKNIYDMIYYPMDAFGRIGKKYGGDDTMFGFRVGPPKSDVSKGMNLAKGLPVSLMYVFTGIKKIVEDPSVVKLGRVAAHTMGEMAHALLGFNKIGAFKIMFLGKAVRGFLGSWKDGVDGLGALLKFQRLGRTAHAFQRMADAYTQIGEVRPFAHFGINKMIKIMHAAKITDTAKDFRSIAISYGKIQETSQRMDLEALEKSTEMFKALAYLTEQGGEDAMATLGDSLIEAVKELASMIANFESTVEAAKESNSEVGNVVGDASKAMGKLAEATSNKATPIGQPTPRPAEPAPSSGGSMQELIDLLESGQVVVKTRNSF